MAALCAVEKNREMKKGKCVERECRTRNGLRHPSVREKRRDRLRDRLRHEERESERVKGGELTNCNQHVQTWAVRQTKKRERQRG